MECCPGTPLASAASVMFETTPGFLMARDYEPPADADLAPKLAPFHTWRIGRSTDVANFPVISPRDDINGNGVPG
jgi:hypothetical protein